MKVTILEPSGYCSGVEHAMKLAIKTKNENPQKSVVILGMLVHNQDSLKELEKHGIKTVFKQNCSYEQLINEIKEPSIVILTAHGHSKSVEKMLIDRGHQIVDATCPFVKNSFQEISKSILENRKVFYIGVENHPEAIAALSISKDVFFVDAKSGNIPEIKCDSPLVISQTTLSKFETKSIFENIKSKYPDAEFLNGICNASTSRQESIMKMPMDVDFVYVVGGANSNNSKTLYELAMKVCKGKGVKMISNESEINKKDLLGLSHIAISSGASTPKEVVERIKQTLLD